MNEKILVTGGTGLLGTDLVKFLKTDYRPLGASRQLFDITDHDQTAAFFQRMQPDIVLHAAAWADVDGCEEDREKAVRVNVNGTANVARACREIGARLIYYSTDYVFDGDKETPYTEDDPTNPINHYGQTKLDGEKAVRETLDNHVIMRISWLFGDTRDCFVTRTFQQGREQLDAKNRGEATEPIKIISDQVSCPTWTADIVEQTARIIESDLTGTVHAVSENQTSRFKLAENIFEELSWDIDLHEVATADFGFKAARPKYSALANRRLTDLNLKSMRDWREAIREFLMVYKG